MPAFGLAYLFGEDQLFTIYDYFVQMRKNGEYQPEPRQIRHAWETLHMLSVLTGDSRFENVINEGCGGVNTMCEVLDRIEKCGLEKGIKQMIIRMYKSGYSIEQIARVAEMTEKSIKKMIG